MVLREVPAENIARPLGRNEVIGLLFRLTVFGAVTYFTIKWMVDAIDPTRKQKVEAQKQVRRNHQGPESDTPTASKHDNVSGQDSVPEDVKRVPCVPGREADASDRG